MLRIAVKTLGCRANRYESDRLLDELGTAATVVDENETADVIVVNTCTVTHVADRKSRQIVTQLCRAHPQAKVVVFGCGARMAKEQYEELGCVDYIASDRHDLRKFILDQKPATLTHDGLYFSSARVDAERTRSLIKIQDGCDRFCTYCIIPFTRGMPQSFASKDVIAEIKEKEAKGYKEIVITGINIGDWKEGDKDFADLLEMMLEQTEIPRIRISSIEPCDFSEKFYEIMQHPRICKHLHLCLQSGSDQVLKMMGRKYDSTVFKMICDRLKEKIPDIAITTDVITGFPGETEKMFQAGKRFIESIGFSKLHVFPYSRRRNTPAAKMEQVPYPQKKAWAKDLLRLSRELETEFKERLVGEKYEVLIEERRKDGRWQGYTTNYVRTLIESDHDLTNELIEVEMKEVLRHDAALGEVTGGFVETKKAPAEAEACTV